MKIVGISFSGADNSMSLRGLRLMDNFIDFHNIVRPDLPIVDNISPDGVVPGAVELLWNQMEEADGFVFAVPEYTGHYSAHFKNVMDWLVVKSNFNADLGTSYPFSFKPFYVVTFTPSGNKEIGGRHFEMTNHLLTKMGGLAQGHSVMNACWKYLLPNNPEFVKDLSQKVLDKFNTYESVERKENSVSDTVSNWNQQYEDWEEAWN